MDERREVREFLVNRRSRIRPADAGLPVYGGNRRVPGLRREEVAMLAGLSVDYYTKLERGNLAGVSSSVLAGISRALQLDETDREHLRNLASRASRGGPTRHPRPEPALRSSLRQVLDAITDAPAWVRNHRYDMLATNELARALFMQAITDTAVTPNLARFTLLNPAAKTFWRDWDRAAADTVAYLRAEAARHPDDRRISDLVGEFATRSPEFPALWAEYDVRFHRTGSKLIHHPIVGDLDLEFEAMEFPSDPGLVLTVYTAAPGSPSADALRLLAAWNADRVREPAGEVAGGGGRRRRDAPTGKAPPA